VRGLLTMGYSRSAKSSDYSDKIPFNNSFGKLERINDWWSAAGKAKILNMTDEYFNCLEQVFIEISSHISTEEEEVLILFSKKIENHLDTSNVPSGQEQFKVQRRRKGSNLCDEYARKLSKLCMSYNLEWFDLKAWSKEQRAKEPVVRG